MDASELASVLKLTPRITKKLKDENDYPSWLMEATRQLRRQRLLTIVNGATTRPTDTGKGQDDWDDLSDKAFDYLMDSCEEEAQMRIRGCSTAAEAWTLLKENYEGKRCTHLLHLFYSVTGSKFDDRKGTIKAYIETFEKAWLCLAQAVATVTPSASTPDGAIVHFTKSDTWKAYTLINSFPRIQPYINIIDHITSKEDTITYANTVLRLKEIPERPTRRQDRSEEPRTAFATDRPQKFCGYCKKAGWPGTSHNEVDCRWKKKDSNKTSAHTTQDDEPEWNGVMSFMTMTETNKDEGWFIDSCATVHITNDIQDLTEVHPHREPVTTGGGTTYSTHRGIATVHGIRLNNVLVIPSFPKKLINIRDITAAGGSLTLSSGNDILKHQGVNIKLIKVGKLWTLPSQEAHTAASKTDIEWHESARIETRNIEVPGRNDGWN